jgi:NAD(P)H-flavin reductase
VVQFHTLLLEIGSAAAQKYTNPGQYLQVRLKGGKAGFYALASTPESSADGTVELLVRCRGENSEQLCQIKDGQIFPPSSGVPPTKPPKLLIG